MSDETSAATEEVATQVEQSLTRAAAKEAAKAEKARKNRAAREAEAELAAQTKRKQALEYRLAGMNYRQIAEKMGWANQSSAHTAVKQALADIPKDAATEMIAVQNEQMLMMQLALVKDVRRGDPNSVGAMLKVMDQQAKLNGLYGATQEEDTISVAVALANFLGGAKEAAARIAAERPEDAAKLDGTAR